MPSGRVDTHNAKLIADHSADLANWAAQALDIARLLEKTAMPICCHRLCNPSRTTLAGLDSTSAELRCKLANDNAVLSIAEIGGLIVSISKHLKTVEPTQMTSFLSASETLVDIVYEELASFRETQESTKQVHPSTVSVLPIQEENIRTNVAVSASGG